MKNVDLDEKKGVVSYSKVNRKRITVGVYLTKITLKETVKFVLFWSFFNEKLLELLMLFGFRQLVVISVYKKNKF